MFLDTRIIFGAVKLAGLCKNLLIQQNIPKHTFLKNAYK